MPAQTSAKHESNRSSATTRRDFQRSRVYAWEEREIAPHPSSTLAFDQAQILVNAIWSEMGLRYPPMVEPLPHQAHRRLGDACRLTIRLPGQVTGWCLLHEIAHAMTTTHDGRSDQHGPIFMGVYVSLLERYLRIPQSRLLASLKASGIAVNATAQPIFLDAT